MLIENLRLIAEPPRNIRHWENATGRWLAQNAQCFNTYPSASILTEHLSAHHPQVIVADELACLPVPPAPAMVQPMLAGTIGAPPLRKTAR